MRGQRDLRVPLGLGLRLRQVRVGDDNAGAPRRKVVVRRDRSLPAEAQHSGVRVCGETRREK